MLRHLSIKDFAVVRATELEFGPGMTVVSGETGAGKSLMVDALGFLSGLRADSGVVRHGAARASFRPSLRWSSCRLHASGWPTTSWTTRSSASCAGSSAPMAVRGPGSTAAR